MRLYDSFGRRFSYLRLSITDACNFRCVYCLPNGYQRKRGLEENYLSLSEIKNLAHAFTEMGMWKIRLTGGEPTLRKDLFEIAQALSVIPGIRKIALSTNAYRLKQIAPELLRSGISALNVSVDSLDRDKFKEITGQDRLHEVLEGIDAAFAAGFSKVKVNAVLLGEWTNEDLTPFMEWIRTREIGVRFIELMPTGQNTSLFKKGHTRGDQIRQRLLEQGWLQKSRSEGDGPAVEFEHPDYQGSVGIIAPYSKDFCSTCNRLRITSYGGLRLCLFGEGNQSLRHLLQEESQREELKRLISSLLQKKEISHYLPEGRYGNNETFSSMGG